MQYPSVSAMLSITSACSRLQVGPGNMRLAATRKLAGSQWHRGASLSLRPRESHENSCQTHNKWQTVWQNTASRAIFKVETHQESLAKEPCSFSWLSKHHSHSGRDLFVPGENPYENNQAGLVENIRFPNPLVHHQLLY